MSKFDRRQFTSLVSLGGLGLLTGQISLLTGCGTGSGSETRETDSSGNSTANILYGVTVYDLMMYGYSTFSGQRLGQTGVLKATMIRDGAAVTLPYTQDGDGHKFNLSAEDFAKLKKGQKVEINTTLAQGHTHKVVIDPAVRAPNAQSIEIPDPSNPGETIFVKIEDVDQPHLFMQGTKPLDPDTVEFCMDTKARCDADKNLWEKSKIHIDRTDRQVLVSESAIATLGQSPSEVPLIVRGKVKGSSTVVETILKLSRRQ